MTITAPPARSGAESARAVRGRRKSRSFVGSSRRNTSNRSRIAASWRRLPTRGALHVEVEYPVGKPDVGRDLSDTCIEVGGTEREIGVERAAVRVVGIVAISRECRARDLECALGVADTRPAPEVGAHGLTRAALGDLGEVADLRGRGCPDHAAGVGRIDAGEDPQQGALAGPVRRDDADPTVRSDRDVHTVEDDVGPERLGDVAGDKAGKGRRRRHGGTCASRADGKARGVPGHYIASQDSAVDAPDRLDFDDDNELVGVRVVGARHAGEAFERARLVDVELVRCDLAGCDFSEAAFHRVRFVDCRCVGAELGQATFRTATFDDCRLDDANFRIAQLASVRFESSVLARTDFGGAQLDEVSFRGCDLTGADFSNARCSKVDLRGARLEGVQGVGSLRGASSASISSSDLRREWPARSAWRSGPTRTMATARADRGSVAPRKMRHRAGPVTLRRCSS